MLRFHFFLRKAEAKLVFTMANEKCNDLAARQELFP